MSSKLVNFRLVLEIDKSCRRRSLILHYFRRERARRRLFASMPFWAECISTAWLSLQVKVSGEQSPSTCLIDENFLYFLCLYRWNRNRFGDPYLQEVFTYPGRVAIILLTLVDSLCIHSEVLLAPIQEHGMNICKMASLHSAPCIRYSLHSATLLQLRIWQLPARFTSTSTSLEIHITIAQYFLQLLVFNRGGLAQK